MADSWKQNSYLRSVPEARSPGNRRPIRLVVGRLEPRVKQATVEGPKVKLTNDRWHIDTSRQLVIGDRVLVVVVRNHVTVLRRRSDHPIVGPRKTATEVERIGSDGLDRITTDAKIFVA